VSNDTANVPDVVIGEPETISPVGSVRVTDVTVPEPAPEAISKYDNADQVLVPLPILNLPVSVS
jgi:hypothetical protein